MNNESPIELFIGFVVFLQAAFVLGISLAVLPFYSKHQASRHIALVAASYVLLTIIVALAINFRIYAYPMGRFVGLILASIAFGLGDYALIIVWNRRVSQSNKEER